MEVINFLHEMDLLWVSIKREVTISDLSEIRYHQHSGFRIESIKDAVKE